MRLIDLTMPIWEGAGYGEILPFTNSPVRFLEYMFYDRHGLRMTRMKLDGETGSPFMVPHQRMPFDTTPLQPNPKFSWILDEIPLERLVLRDTVILDIRVEEGHEIMPAEMETAITRADYRRGDEVLLRTGWGTRQKAYELGIDYYKRTPSIHYDAAALLAVKMDEMDSSIFMTDCALVNPPRVQGNNWFRGDTPLAPLPKPWPSAEARERVLDLGAHKHGSPHPSSYGALIKKAMAGCKCLVDCDQITKPRVKMIILPLLIKKGGASPCRFIAVEE
ncbi:MAG TPA: cyclase family protein [Candidatus Bathyarchaeia archaeon]|nr:cyclase family protein [Candidatus Bathyarchaeia archaeon]